jgi:hypothetical protein
LSRDRSAWRADLVRAATWRSRDRLRRALRRLLLVGFSTFVADCVVSGTAPVAVESLRRVRRALRRGVLAVSVVTAAAGSAETCAEVACPAPDGVASPRHQLSIELDQLEELEEAGVA